MIFWRFATHRNWTREQVLGMTIRDLIIYGMNEDEAKSFGTPEEIGETCVSGVGKRLYAERVRKAVDNLLAGRRWDAR